MTQSADHVTERQSWVAEKKIIHTGLQRQDVYVVLSLAQNWEFRSNEWDGEGPA